MEKQHTTQKSAYVSGIALHTGARAGLRILPGEANTGIIFRRIDMPDQPEIPALAQNVTDVRRGTTIACGKGFVVTVEHVMAAFHAAQIDNAVVEMDGPEPPILDGSALPYYEMIIEAGKTELDAPARYIAPKTPIFLEFRGTKMVIFPCEEFKIDCITSFGETILDTQYYEQTITEENFARELAPARTFVQFRDLKQLLAMGLVKGGSLDNAAILHEGAIICKEGLRYPNEIVRHKMLDIVGDMFLTGCRLKGHIIAVKPGHPTNVQLAGAILKQYC
ncbi:MAG: UDP-3-O-acyl-N-acetylglucosamine deacetylase [Victivallales bacterium]|nr:UDP-3-O-acyl-N-acetylglucosamine deacetylase [Victivallales bacterium]